jgi:hypothetical protein
MTVGVTSWANTQDANGNWIFPAYVDVPGLPYQELPGGVNRNTVALAINDAGEIVGSRDIADPDNPSELTGEGSLWQLNPDGSIGDPVSLGAFFPYDINNYGVMAGTVAE